MKELTPLQRSSYTQKLRDGTPILPINGVSWYMGLYPEEIAALTPEQREEDHRIVLIHAQSLLDVRAGAIDKLNLLTLGELVHLQKSAGYPG